jgi:lipopolysaccharide/colanic/teichoic acid biosynthesis glycosyltransferase
MEIEATEFAESDVIMDSTLVEELEIESARLVAVAPSILPAMSFPAVTLPAVTRQKPRGVEAAAPRSSVISLEWPLVSPAGNRSSAYLCVKRTLDLVGGLVLLALLSPLLFATLLVLTITTKGHPIFCQQRLGFCGRPFRMYKFRTMVLNALELQARVANEKQGPIFKNFADPRVTRIGRFLRSFSIDEMPQLVNVILGQMSLVGPRPPLACEVAKYESWQLQRLAVKPGLTCLWQVSGRSEISFALWVEMDLWYLDNQGFGTDLNLLLRTPWSVISRRGAC